jgi:predicted aldo/keto reductase-like oxidoreductase
MVTRALDLGVGYIDTAPDYTGVELRIAEALVGRRKDVFLATKTPGRTYDASMQYLEDSLKRLRTDHLDLWQLHNIASQDEVDKVSAKGGAIEALVKARDEGIVRFVGFTGHYSPDPLLSLIDRFDFDTLLVALNAADWQRLPMREKLIPRALEKGMGVIAMKTLGGPGGAILKQLTTTDALSYVWSLPITTTIVGAATIDHLTSNIDTVRDFTPLDEARMRAVETSMTVDEAHAASWFKGA